MLMLILITIHFGFGKHMNDKCNVTFCVQSNVVPVNVVPVNVVPFNVVPVKAGNRKILDL